MLYKVEYTIIFEHFDSDTDIIEKGKQRFPFDII